MFFFKIVIFFIFLKGYGCMLTYRGTVMENSKVGERIFLNEPIYVRNRSLIDSEQICGYTLFQAPVPFRVELLEPFTGSAFLVVNGDLDYEKETSYQFKMAAYGCGTSGNTFSPRENVVVSVEDVNDNRPHWLPLTGVTAADDDGGSGVVAAVAAADDGGGGAVAAVAADGGGVVVVHLKQLQLLQQQQHSLQQQQQQQYKQQHMDSSHKQQRHKQRQRLRHKLVDKQIQKDNSTKPSNVNFFQKLVCLKATDADVTVEFSKICRYITSNPYPYLFSLDNNGCLSLNFEEDTADDNVMWGDRIRKIIINNNIKNNNNNNHNNNNRNNNNQNNDSSTLTEIEFRVYAIDCGGLVSDARRIRVLLDG